MSERTVAERLFQDMSAPLAASLRNSWLPVRAFMSCAHWSGAACMTSAPRMRLHVDLSQPSASGLADL